MLAGVVVGACAHAPPRLTVPAISMPAKTNRAALFPDELARLQSATHAAVMRREDRLVELAPVDTVAKLATPTCAAPMSGEAVVERYYRRSPRLTTTAECVGHACRLVVRVINAPPDGVGAWTQLNAWSAEVDAPETIDGWLAAAERLVNDPTPQKRSPGVDSTADAPELLRIHWISVKGPWRVEPSKQAFARQQEALNICHVAGWPSTSTEHAVMAIGADGVPTRCHATVQRGDDQARLGCLCGAMTGVRFPTGAAGRRVEVGLVNTAGAGVRSGGRTVHARFERVRPAGGFTLHPGLDGLRQPLAQCFARSGVLGRTSTRIRIEVDAEGHVLRAGTLDPGDLNDRVAACIDRTLQATAFACTWDDAPAALDAVLTSYSLATR